MDTFAKRFRECREKANLKQREIAAVCLYPDGESIERAAVSYWESQTDKDRTRPSLDWLVAAAKKMGASIDYMTGLTNTTIGYEPLDPASLDLIKKWESLPQNLKDNIEGQIQAFSSTVYKTATFNQDDIYKVADKDDTSGKTK